MRGNKPLLELTAEDVMSREVVTIPQRASMREAAHLLLEANVGAAAVLDERERCVGVLSAFDFLRWAEGQAAADGAVQARACPYLSRGALPGDRRDRWICVLAPGSCPLQAARPTTGGRHVSVCRRPGISPAAWHLARRLPADSVRRYATADVVTAGPRTPLPELARMMIDADVHRVFVSDESGRAVGVVSSTDLMAALAAEGARQEWATRSETARHEGAGETAAAV
jgi:CBS-domain-containing membrane protein